MKGIFIESSKYCKLIRTMALLGLGWMLAFVPGEAQSPEFRYHASPLTGGLRPIVNLQGIWMDENGNRHMVPFNYFDRDEMRLTRRFDLQDIEKLQDTLYLYCEAVAWSSEITLNDRLLVVTDDPFAEHLLPLDKEWLLPKGNTLKINLSTKGLRFPWYPKRFLGIFRQLLLMQVDSLPSFPAFSKTIAHAPKGALIAAWSPEMQYLDDSLVIEHLSKGLFSFPDRVPLAFPFRPSNMVQSILVAAGWEVLASPEGADSLAVYNAFPFSAEAGHKNPHFWRDPDMRPTMNYGHYQSKAAITAPELTQPNKVSLLIFLLIPVFSMTLLKIAAPKAYGSLGEYLTKTKIYLELIGDNKFLKVEQRWLMNSIRMILTSVSVTLFLYYVQLSESWQFLNVFSSHSILFQALYGSDMPMWQLFLLVFMATVSLNLLKYFMINGIGGIFRLFSLGPSIQNLDVFCAFPTNLMPVLPASFIFFLDASTGGTILRIWAVLFLLYGARRVWLMFSGLGKLYQISGSLKILYICTLEILPWVVLI